MFQLFQPVFADEITDSIHAGVVSSTASVMDTFVSGLPTMFEILGALLLVIVICWLIRIFTNKFPPTC